MTTVVTVLATTQQQRDRLAAFRHPRYRYVCWLPDTDSYAAAFGMPLGAFTRAEAVYWAEHWATKNGGTYLPPIGWDDVRGELSSLSAGMESA